ncbi:uncharacterized protein J3R85_009507, partial [Psidium guajava]
RVMVPLSVTPVNPFFVLDVEIERALSIGIGATCFLLLFMAILFVHVAETVMYFVCKLDVGLHKNVDKSFLAEHIQAYLGVNALLPFSFPEYHTLEDFADIFQF